jgi:hypothetical protein
VKRIFLEKEMKQVLINGFQLNEQFLVLVPQMMMV